MNTIHLPWLAKYGKAFELGFQTALEYRANFVISLISAAYPIFIQTFLWTAIFSASQSQTVYGYSYRQMIVYTFLAGLVARIVRTGFEYEIMDDVKSGKYSKFLVQPLGYFAYRLSSFYGGKLPHLAIILVILACVLVGLVFVWGFPITFLQILAFLLSMVLAITLNFLLFYCLSAIAFWVIEIGFLFEGVRIVAILLSGGIFPLEVFGELFMQISNLMPFKYTINYPITLLNGKTDISSFAAGALIQGLWIAAFYLLAGVLWRTGGRRYVAVGG